MFTDGQLDGQTDAGEFPDRNNIKKGPRYPSMSEPTGGLGDPLALRPTGILSSNTCHRNSIKHSVIRI